MTMTQNQPNLTDHYHRNIDMYSKNKEVLLLLFNSLYTGDDSPSLVATRDDLVLIIEVTQARP